MCCARLEPMYRDFVAVLVKGQSQKLVKRSKDTEGSGVPKRHRFCSELAGDATRRCNRQQDQQEAPLSSHLLHRKHRPTG